MEILFEFEDKNLGQMCLCRFRSDGAMWLCREINGQYVTMRKASHEDLMQLDALGAQIWRSDGS
jgi:hypothetical protein